MLRGRPEGAGNEHLRILPDEALAPYVAHFWWVRWTLEAPRDAETLPHPSVHLVFEGGAGEVAGVHRRRFVRRLEAQGAVFGVKLRPATFGPILGGSVSSISDRRVPVGAVFGPEGEALARRLDAADRMEDRVALAEAFLRPRLPPLPRELARLRDLVERMAEDRDLLRVEQAATLAGLDVRALQRRFLRFVGVSPKWVLQRYRMHEAAERLQADAPSLAALAAELGYADQAHFARDFKAAVGRTPRQFVADCARGDDAGSRRPASKVQLRQR